MPKAHLEMHLRTCGGLTVVVGQEDVYVDGKLWAVEGDVVNHGGGPLIASTIDVWINGKLVIVHAPDNSGADSLCPIAGGQHCTPMTAQGFDDVFVNGE